ncbi:MAG TPA: DUF1592 domain-containing protein [Gemmataceae bacterium]
MRNALLLLAGLGLFGLTDLPAADSPRADDAGFTRTVKPFLQRHCTACHGPKRQEAELRLDTISGDLLAGPDAAKWHEVLARLHKGEMPPEGRPRPPAAEQAKVIDWITREQRKAEAAVKDTGGRVVLRRLNRAEYNNTVRDLVGIDFTPADDFPADPPAHGFDNIGSALTVSPLHVEKYLAAAREILDRAVVTGPAPKPVKYRFELEEKGWRSRPEGRRQVRYALVDHGKGTHTPGEPFVRLPRDDTGAGFGFFDFPAAGDYVIRVRAWSVIPPRQEVAAAALKKTREGFEKDLAKTTDPKRRQQMLARWEREAPERAAHFQTDPVYDYGPPRLKLTDDRKNVLAEVDVPNPADEPRVYEFRRRFAAGRGGVRVTNSYSIPRLLENFWFTRHDDFPRPTLFVDWIEVEGPVTDGWPPPSHRRIFFDSPNRHDEDVYAKEVLQRFMTRAFRRPVRPEELERMLALFAKVRPQKPSFEEAVKVPLAAVLTSPHFLYLVEPNDGGAPRPLTDHELASRLSYFLWSSMPDDELFALANSGKLRDAEALAGQVDRMLKDPKSRALVENFTGQWLGVRDLGKVVPDRGLYPWYDDHLQESMARESYAFFAEVLHNDLSVRNFIDSDFAVLNERMARFYGIGGVRGDHFRRVPVKPGDHRGGVLTQASVLTVTSNGTRTSPVVRGVWVLENPLGDPPPPPPPDAGDLAPKVPGIDKATVRVRLEAHRRLANCAACHNKIDPLGFALENYDAVGRWREREGFGPRGRVNPNDPPIDASGKLPDGRSFVGVGGLKKLLLEDEDRFLDCLTGKMLTYALGRGVEPTDRELVRELREGMKRDGYTLRGLIKGIVRSDAFRMK